VRTILGLTALMDDTTNLEEVIKAYADSLEANGKAEKTILWYTENLLRIEVWLEEQLGRKAVVGDLDVEICEAYLAYRRRIGRAAATVRGDAMTLKAFASWLARKRSIKGRRQDSVLTHLSGGPAKDKDTRDQEPLTDEELERLLAHFDPNTFNGLRTGCLMRLMVDCGCRQGEALSARARDIVWPRNEVVITGKTGTRSVKFSDETAAWLDRYVREREGWARDGVECLIINERGHPLGENGLYTCSPGYVGRSASLACTRIFSVTGGRPISAGSIAAISWTSRSAAAGPT
jgi:site-specific recombinase XerD